MSVIKLKNISNTNFIFTEIGPTDDRGIVRGKKVGCIPGNNILVTNEEEIEKSSLLQQLIVDRKLVPLENNSENKDNLKKEETSDYEESEDTINLIAGSDEDAKDLQEYLNSKERKEVLKAKDVITQQPFTKDIEEKKIMLEKNEPDPKGANGTDLFYQKPPRDIFVDDHRPESDLYKDYSEKKNVK